ncbi:Hypothetical predicted protein [Podarcis lilfordi]|uniref:Uncharacterized protein n=1 Tax=Podarcis lilfordi TaxID=74358 RepID=A0AA35KPH9_9SAUR|nr:Hypothetical predicted protein [Podarcis lilfordi]
MSWHMGNPPGEGGSGRESERVPESTLLSLPKGSFLGCTFFPGSELQSCRLPLITCSVFLEKLPGHLIPNAAGLGRSFLAPTCVEASLLLFFLNPQETNPAQGELNRRAITSVSHNSLFSTFQFPYTSAQVWALLFVGQPVHLPPLCSQEFQEMV